MATTTIQAPEQHPPTDPFFYGWRMVPRTRADGGTDWEMVPLTAADALHPQEGDHVTQSALHAAICRYLASVAEGQFPPEEPVLILQDVLIIWDTPDRQRHSPDLAVIPGVPRDWEASSYDVAKEGARPVLIAEVTSLATVEGDRGDKLAHYAARGVPWYVLVDLVAQPLATRAYRLVEGHYQPAPADERGWLWLAPLRLWLAVEGQGIACYDAQGARIGDLTAQRAARQAEAAAREAAERQLASEIAARREAEERAAALEARLRELEVELRRLRREGGGAGD